MPDRKGNVGEIARGGGSARRRRPEWPLPRFRLVFLRVSRMANAAKEEQKEKQPERAASAGSPATRRQHELLLACANASANPLAESDSHHPKERAPDFRVLP